MGKTHAPQEPAKVVIAGGGIVGLVLALALKEHVGVTAEIYEKAKAFHDDVGAALGMYPNGLRVLRDIDPMLVRVIREQGASYTCRSWERHDGSVITQAQESVLTLGDEELASVGIRRWKLQKILYDSLVAAGIQIHFNKATHDVTTRANGLVEVTFSDGTKRLTEVLFACDGGKSKVREKMAGKISQLAYTGTTCLMGMAPCELDDFKGIHFPSSNNASNCHSVYFPTGHKEMCFQIHVPIDADKCNKSNWGSLAIEARKNECKKMAEMLRASGWHEKYIKPLERATRALNVGFCLLEPRLKEWVFGPNKRIVLVGDAAHVPVPFVGQGAQMGIEDAGTIALLMKKFCLDRNGELNLKNFEQVTTIYQKLRIPRTSEILDCSKSLGEMQDRRRDTELCEIENLILEAEVLFNDTLPVMFPGATFNYREDIEKEIQILEGKRKIVPCRTEELCAVAESHMRFY